VFTGAGEGCDFNLQVARGARMPSCFPTHYRQGEADFFFCVVFFSVFRCCCHFSLLPAVVAVWLAAELRLKYGGGGCLIFVYTLTLTYRASCLPGLLWPTVPPHPIRT